MVGIVAYGAYVPRLRLSRQAVYDANKWFAAGLRGLAKGERSMANWDEDSITMAVEASRDCSSQLALSRRLGPIVGRACRVRCWRMLLVQGMGQPPGFEGVNRTDVNHAADAAIEKEFGGLRR